MWGERIRKKNSKNNDKINFIIPLLFLSVTIVLFTGAASAADIYVNGTGGNDDDPGTSWSTAKKTIYGGITAVGTGETVNIANETYTGEKQHRDKYRSKHDPHRPKQGRYDNRRGKSIENFHN
jgi:hypothetical protein